MSRHYYDKEELKIGTETGGNDNRNGENTRAPDLETRTILQEQYRSNPTKWFRWVFNIIRFPDKALILELGSGTGDLWLENRHNLVKGWKFVLSDLSTEMVIRLRRNLSQLEDSFYYGVWDAGATPFMENQFDGVIGLGLLDEILQPEPILDEIWRVMKTGGKFYATAGGMHHLQELESIARQVLPEADFGGHPERFGLENGKRILSRKFCSIHRYRFPDKLVFDRVTPVLRYILSEAAVREQMTPEKTRQLTHLIQELLDKQRSISITSDKGIFQAEKK